MRLIIAIALLAGFTGCGPMFIPMMPQLDAEDQKKVDQMWDNLLTPVQRVDRETLLDTNIAEWMYAFGVDRMRMTSEKYFSGGKVVMEMDCDRANPDTDSYSILVLDDRGRTLRRERYTRADVEESAKMLRGLPNLGSAELRALNADGPVTIEFDEPTTQPSTRPTTQPTTQPVTRPTTQRVLTPEELQFLRESKRRQAAVEAATQPARLVPAGRGSGSPAKRKGTQ